MLGGSGRALCEDLPCYCLKKSIPQKHPPNSPAQAVFLSPKLLLKNQVDNLTQEEAYYDLATPEGQEQYRDAVEERATAWAKNFEELGGGDGTPYELGEGMDLWIDLVERWDDEFDGDAVSDQDLARQLGAEVCEQVIAALVSKRRLN
jgi:hypothetical protein